MASQTKYAFNVQDKHGNTYTSSTFGVNEAAAKASLQSEVGGKGSTVLGGLGGSRMQSTDVTQNDGSKARINSYGAPSQSTLKAITADTLGATKINLPNAPVPTNQNGLITSNNAGLVNPTMGTSIDGKGALVYTQPEQPKDNYQALLDKYLGAQTQAPSAEETYNKLPEKKALERAQQDVQNYASQINTITANRDANQLAVTGQGRGIPEVIIGGQQAQISKEAAIQALPIQALLANAQGNVELAQSHLDTVFKLRMEDAKNAYEYKNKVLDSVYNFATASEKRRLDDLQHQNDQNFTLLRDSTSFTQQLSAKALENNDARAAASFAQISTPDPSSSTFAQDLAEYNAAVSKVTSTMKPDALRQAQINSANRANQPSDSGPKVVTVNGVDSIWDAKSGRYIPVPTNGPTTNTTSQAASKSNIDQLTAINSNTAIRSAVGPSFLGRWIGRGLDSLTGSRQNFIADVNQVADQLTIDNLVKAKQNGATFGALSDSERQLLANSGTKLNSWAIRDSKTGSVKGYSASEKDFKKEIDKINNFAKLDYVLKGGEPSSIGAQVHPDGTVWTLNSDGTVTQLK